MIMSMRRNSLKGVPIVERIAAMEEWMRHYDSSALREQRHLIRNSTERTYWNYGYLIALREALDLITGKNNRPIDYRSKQDMSGFSSLSRQPQTAPFGEGK